LEIEGPEAMRKDSTQHRHPGVGSANVSAGKLPPLHQQITSALIQQMEEGQLRPGDQLPPEIDLAQQWGVSRQTMRVSLDTLVRAGRLDRQRGKGTVVRRPPLEQSLARFYSIAQEMRQRGADLQTRVLARGRLASEDDLAALACERLGINAAHQVGYVLRLRLSEGEPFLLETLTFPVTLCPDLLEVPAPGQDDPGAASFYEVLATRMGIQVTRARETFRPLLATGYEARLLGVPAGTPVFEVERSSFVGEQPVEWRRTLARGDRYTYVVDLVNPNEEHSE
jgi:GntR family transcriptional regulator